MKSLSKEAASKAVALVRKRLDASLKPDEDDERVSSIPVVSHENIDLGNHIANGTFADIYEVKSIHSSNTSDDVVLKTLRPRLLSNIHLFANTAADLIREGMILSTLKHPNVISIRAWSSSRGAESYYCGQNDAFFLVLERIECTLKAKLQNWRDEYEQRGGVVAKMLGNARRKKFLQSIHQERSNILLDLGKAVTYLHSQNIIHRDLKPDNIGFDHDGTLKLIDFDVATLLPDKARYDHSSTFKLTRNTGSPRYMSPECARGDCYNRKSDVYTYGLICYELFTLKKPYYDLPSKKHRQLVFREGVRPKVPRKARWPSNVRTVVQKCWSEKISERPGMAEVVTSLHEYLPQWTIHRSRQTNRKDKGNNCSSDKNCSITNHGRRNGYRTKSTTRTTTEDVLQEQYSQPSQRTLLM